MSHFECQTAAASQRCDLKKQVIRACHILPAPVDRHGMVFAKKQIQSLARWSVVNHLVFLESRTSFRVLYSETQRLQRELKEFNPDVVHAHYGTMTAAIAAISSRIPLVITYRGSDLNPCPSISLIRSAAGRLLSQIAACRAERIICVSSDLREKLWRGRDSVRVIPSGIDLSVFHPVSQEKSRLDLGWPLNRKVVLFNAGLDPQVKRIDLARTAVAAARKLSLEFDFVVLNGKVDHEKVPSYLNAADCLLVTSDWEGSPNIVKEAIACDLPVVTVAVGDVRERLGSVRPSRIVGRSPEEIAKGLAEILWQSHRSNGHEIIGELSSEKIAEQIVGLYQEVITA